MSHTIAHGLYGGLQTANLRLRHWMMRRPAATQAKQTAKQVIAQESKFP